MLCDLFCRVIDNWGDVGVCWRLTADLRARGEQVRLWVDEPAALDWMAPGATDVHRWVPDTPWPEPGDVVVEAFGCDLPPEFLWRMSQRAKPPVWINLEYLTAEPYARRNHGLRSPQQGAGAGMEKFFFYPGWTPDTGGLQREPDLASRQARFDATAWLQQQGLTPRPGEQRVSLFCYDNPALPGLLETLRAAAQPTLLLATAGLASEQVRACLPQANPGTMGNLRVAYLPRLSQVDFDHLLWASDVNLVRGEDSFVRAQWADRPFIWQIYPQDDGAHARKLDAWHGLWDGLVGLAPGQRALSLAWNSLADPAAPLPWPADWTDWRARSRAWGQRARGQADLVTQLRAFTDSHRRGPPR